MRLYGDLAPWFHLLTAPEDYAAEAERYRALIHRRRARRATLLELGSGGGNNASHLKRHFTCTLSDVSPQMLTLSRELNPECEHVLGDMRTLRLGGRSTPSSSTTRSTYLTTEDDLAGCIGTASRTRGPAASPSSCRTSRARRSRRAPMHGGHDGADGRSLRYLEWSDPTTHPATRAYEVDYVVLLSEPGADAASRPRPPRPRASSPEHTWLYLLEAAGLTRGSSQATPTTRMPDSP